MLFTKNAVIALAAFNLVFYLIRASVAGDMLNGSLDGAMSIGENAATPILTQTTMIVTMIGGASMLVGFIHVYEWNNETRLVGTGISVIALMLAFLCMGYAFKVLAIGCNRHAQMAPTCTDSDNSLSEKTQFIAAGAIIQWVFHLLYVVVIYLTPVETEGVVGAIVEAKCDSSEAERCSARECF